MSEAGLESAKQGTSEYLVLLLFRADIKGINKDHKLLTELQISTARIRVDYLHLYRHIQLQGNRGGTSIALWASGPLDGNPRSIG
jgi:hypothetical protein